MARLKETYEKEIVPRLMEAYGIGNRLAAPRLTKIVVNAGAGEAAQDAKLLDPVLKDLTRITGQKPQVCRARKSVSAFKLRKGSPAGCKVTLRGARMYEFVDRLISLAIPRIRDFRGLNPGSFDKDGNFSLGISEQSIFPEIDIDDVERTIGMDVVFVIENGSPERSLELLRQFGMPFRQSAAVTA